AVGDFDVVDWAPIPPNAVRDRPLPLRGIAPKGDGAKMTFALEQTPSLIALLEEYFAIPYPYAKLDLVAVPAMGPSGLETAGAISYRTDRILVDGTPVNGPGRDFLYLHVHELSHSWFGDLVTPAWWDDLWLNESFATWMTDRVLSTWRPADFHDRGSLYFA